MRLEKNVFDLSGKLITHPFHVPSEVIYTLMTENWSLNYYKSKAVIYIMTKNWSLIHYMSKAVIYTIKNGSLIHYMSEAKLVILLWKLQVHQDKTAGGIWRPLTRNWDKKLYNVQVG